MCSTLDFDVKAEHPEQDQKIHKIDATVHVGLLFMQQALVLWDIACSLELHDLFFLWGKEQELSVVTKYPGEKLY